MNSKYVLIGLVLAVSIPIFLVAGIFNLYIFGGVAFPNDSFGDAYFAFWMVAVYGGAISMPLIAAGLVRARDIGPPDSSFTLLPAVSDAHAERYADRSRSPRSTARS